MYEELKLKDRKLGLKYFAFQDIATMKKSINNILCTGNELFCFLIYIILYGYIIGLFFCISTISVFVMLLSLEAFL